MTPELQKYFDNVFSTLRSEGWKQIIEDIEPRIDALEQSILSFPLEPSVSDYAKGKLAVYREFMNLDRTLSNAFDKAAEAEDLDE